jgi:hypothetical protein
MLECSNKRELHPVFTAMLGCAYGKENLTTVALTLFYAGLMVSVL